MPPHIKYLDIRNRIEAAIRGGAFQDGRLPSFQRLTRLHKASLMTVRRAVKQLEKEGYVTCHANARGTVINVQTVARLASSVEESDHPVACSLRERVRLRYFNPEYRVETKSLWDALLSDFHDHYPWIDVAIDAPNPRNEYSPEPPAGADLIQMMARDLADYRDRGWIGDWADLARRDSTFSDTGWTDVVRKAARNEAGILAGIPQSLGIPLVFYRPDALRCVYPFADDWNWRQFQITAKHLFLNGWLTAMNLGLMTYWSCCLGEPERYLAPRSPLKSFAESIERLRIFKEQARKPSDLKQCYQQRHVASKFQDGRVALFVGYSFYMTHFLKGTTTWDILPPPLDRGGFPRVEIMVNAAGSSSVRKREAWLLAKFIASEPAQRRIVAAGGLPVISAVLDDDTAWPQPLRARRRMVRAMIAKARPMGCSSWLHHTVYNRIAYPVLADYFQDTTTLAEACALLKQRCGELISVFATNEGKKP